MTDSSSDYFYNSADGLMLYCRVYPAGRPGGVPVICLPGVTRNSRDFAELARHLSNQHEVLAPDMRGRGRSDWDPDFTHYQPGTYVLDVWTLLNSRNVHRVIVIGTSLGALMGMIMAATAPGRVVGLILNDAGPEIDPVGLKRIAAYVGQLPSVSTWAEAAAQAKRIYGSALPGLTDADWLDYARRAYREKEGIPVPDLDPNIAQGFKNPPPVSTDLWSVYEKIPGIPMLVIRGAHSDILAERTVARMVRDQPDVQHITVPNRGHAPLLNEPECLAGIDAFVAKHGIDGLRAADADS